MRRTRTAAATAVVAALAATSAVLAPATQAAPAPKTKTLATGLITPLRAAIAPDGTAYVTQNFAGQMLRIKPGGKPKRIYRAPQAGAEVGAVSVRGGTVTFATTPAEDMPPERALGRGFLTARPRSAAEPSAKVLTLRQIKKRGKTRTIVRTLADVGAHEAKNNPDGGVTYGFSDLDPECAAMLPPFLLPYPGETYSHPYATATMKSTTYLADAGANDVLSISKTGKVRTLAVLPAVKVVATQEVIDAATAAGSPLPPCVLGKTYTGEPVPTDIEVGPGGKLYVSTLGGGIGEILPVGAVYRIDPKTGKATRLLGGLFTPVGVAVTGGGTIYAAELYSGRVVRARKGANRATTFATKPMPAEVELAGGDLYATFNVLTPRPAGKLVRFR
ncbi:ScyD/ScyE family protein [Nocardioides sambongensis]|uniref:ScyD/ScyE family protein n=1 Tax=Nocardioides sambongensis TaxID=2589074 RepID=UPI0011297FC2|nr:ScyD/ScyE family protein [Nocardioides sambongensis]